MNERLLARVRRSWPLVRVLTVREFRARYRQSALELAWGLITPVVTLAVYGVVLTRLFHVDGNGAPYLSMVWIGMVVWTMFSTAVVVGVQSLVANADLVSKVYFPREVLPLSIVGASLVDLVIGLVVLVPLLAVQVGRVGLCAVAALPVLVVVLVWAAAITVFTATVSVFLRDAMHATRLAIQVGFFASPIMYSTAILPPNLYAWSRINPLAVCIDALRAALLFHRWPEWRWLAVHAVAGVVALIGAVLVTRAVEDRMVDVI